MAKIRGMLPEEERRQTDTTEAAGRPAPVEEELTKGFVPQNGAEPVLKMTKERISRAYETLMKYKSGKAQLESRLIEVEQWWKLRHWEWMQETDPKDSMKTGSAWLFNVIVSKHADGVGSIPEANILPREESDKATAKALSAIVPCVLEQNGFEEVYSDILWQKLKGGTGAYGCFWDPGKLNSLGDIAISCVNLLNLYWEPGVKDIQKSRNVFYVEAVDRELLKQQYPVLKDKPVTGRAVSNRKFMTEDRVDDADKAYVIDWYPDAKRRLDHVFDVEEFKRLPEKIKKPIAVIASSSQSGTSVVELIHMKSANGKQAIAAVYINKSGKINKIDMDTHAISTVHGRNNTFTKLLKDAIDAEIRGETAIYFWDKKRAMSLIQRAGLNVSRSLPSDGYIHSIRENGSPVNEKFENQTETQQFKRWFGNSKIVNPDGTPKVMYHGSPAQFTVFDRKKAKSGGLYGRGFYFSDSETHAGTYGQRYAVYLNIRHPITPDGEKISRASVRKFIEAVAENEDDYSIENYGTYDVDEVLRKVMGAARSKDTFEVIQDINATAIGDMVEAVKLFNEVNGTDYDGIVVPTETVAFEATQIKSATDNIGTFDPENPDIRYQARDSVSTSDRELLANMMESAASNETERDFVRRYRSKFDTLAEKQQELEKVHENIRRMMDEGVKKNRDELIKERNRERILSSYIERNDTELLKWEASKPIREIISRQRKETAARVRREKDESADKKKYRAKIRKDVKQLREWLVSPNNKGHVPELLREPVGRFLEALDAAEMRGWNSIPETKTAERFLQAMHDVQTALSKAKSEDSAEYIGFIDLPARYTDAFGELANSIEKQLKSGIDMASDPLRGMTAQQMRDLSELISTLNTSIRQMNDFLANARYTSAIAAAHDTMETLDRMGEKKEIFKPVEGASDFMNWKNTTPYYAFKRFGDGGKAIFEGLMNGWDKLANNSQAAIDYAEKTYTAKEVREWAKQVHEIKLRQDGKEVSVKITTAQLMSLYCLARREQAQRHLAGGGIRIAEIDASRGRKIRQAANYTLTDADVSAMTAKLTQRQREVADKLQQYMQGTCAQWGNEVSMKRFGYNAFTEANYFPIETDSNNRKAADEQAREQDMYRLLNLSATKALTPKANNAIVIRDIFDVFAAHTSDMAKYNALALPILDALKWYNYVEKTDENKDGGFGTYSVQKSVEAAYGSVAKRYIMSFLKDLNGVSESGRNDSMFSKAISRSKVASVGANVRVYALQITSMPRAAYAISPRYLTAGLAKASAHIARSMREAEEKVGIARWKSLGFYDTNISRNVKGMLKHDQGVADAIAEKSMALAGVMDGVTMAVIYEAAKEEIRHRMPGLSGAARDKAVNDRVREIVYQTQVVDSTMTRSDLMRSKGMATLSTAFMSEPTLTMNMLNDAVFEMQMNARTRTEIEKRKANKQLEKKKYEEIDKKLKVDKPAAMKKMVRALAIYGFVGTFTAIMEAAFDAERDDDEYETFGEKFKAAFIGEVDKDATAWERFKARLFSNLGSNLNPLNSIPVVSDAMSIFEGYSNSSMYTQWLESLMSAWEAYQKYEAGAGGYTAYTWIYNGLKGVSQAVGLPGSNAAREVVSAWNTFVADRAGLPRIQTYASTVSEAAEAYYKAIRAEDPERAAYIEERVEIDGLDMEKVRDGIRSLVKADYIAGDIEEEAAQAILTEHAGDSERDAGEDLTKWSYTRETGLAYGDMKSDYLQSVFDRDTAVEYLMEYGGKREKDAEATVDTWDAERETGYAYGSTKTYYLDGEMTRTEAKDYLTTYKGKSDEEAEEQLLEWDYEMDTGLSWSELKTDYLDGVVTEAQVRKYLSQYGGKDEEEIEETLSGYDYTRMTGKTGTAPKYWRIGYAAETGTGLAQAASDAFDAIMAKGKSYKQARSQIASSLKSYFADEYLEAKGTPEGDRMLEIILDAYEAIGYSRDYERNYIAENWE